jgi:hypothetical protein
VLANPKWQKAALVLNLVGTGVLFYSFQATSSDFRLVTAPLQRGQRLPIAAVVAGSGGNLGDRQYALCVNNYTLLSSDVASGIRLAYRGCPSWQDAKPAAVVSIEHPRFEGLGFFLLILGFGLQYFAVPQPATIAYLHNELKRQSSRKGQRSYGEVSVPTCHLEIRLACYPHGLDHRHIILAHDTRTQTKKLSTPFSHLAINSWVLEPR